MIYYSFRLFSFLYNLYLLSEGHWTRILHVYMCAANCVCVYINIYKYHNRYGILSKNEYTIVFFFRWKTKTECFFLSRSQCLIWFHFHFLLSSICFLFSFFLIFMQFDFIIIIWCIEKIFILLDTVLDFFSSCCSLFEKKMWHSILVNKTTTTKKESFWLAEHCAAKVSFQSLLSPQEKDC